MARFRKSVVLRPLARREVAEYLAVGFDVAESLTTDRRASEDGTLTAEDGRVVPHLRLRSGTHLRPGAVYDLPEPEPEPEPEPGAEPGAEPKPAGREPGAAGGNAVDRDAAPAPDAVRELTLLAWDRRGDTGVRLALGEPGVLLVTSEGWLRGTGRPARLECSGEVTPSPTLSWSRLRRLTWSGRLDLDRWYAATGSPRARAGRGRVALAGRLEHRWARGSFQVVPHPTTDGRWRTVVRLDLRGRGVLRPLAAVGLLLARGRIDRGLDDWLREAARRWEGWVGHARVGDREALRRRIVDELCAPSPGSGAGDGDGSGAEEKAGNGDRNGAGNGDGSTAARPGPAR